jgi:hypothetical protein
LYNIFNDAATPLLFYKIEFKYWEIVKAFMVYLDRLPPEINTNDIDEQCLKNLNQI